MPRRFDQDISKISLVPPQIVADNAAKGLALRAKFGPGGTEIGVGRAQELVARRALQPSTIRRMVSFFARHEVDKRAKNFGNEENPSAGYVAWSPPLPSSSGRSTSAATCGGSGDPCRSAEAAAAVQKEPVASQRG